jgi:rod shape-determining protein MreD
MNSPNIQRYLILFGLLIILQIPLLHNWVFYDVGFPFIYIGFLLFLPQNLGRGWVMIVGFVIGLLMDIFSNTPGMHAFATVLVCFVRLRWYNTILESTDQDIEISLTSVGWPKLITAFLPLIVLHHLTLFVLENEGFNGLGHLLAKVFWSSIVSFFLIALIAFATAPKKKR